MAISDDGLLGRLGDTELRKRPKARSALITDDSRRIQPMQEPQAGFFTATTRRDGCMLVMELVALAKTV